MGVQANRMTDEDLHRACSRQAAANDANNELHDSWAIARESNVDARGHIDATESRIRAVDNITLMASGLPMVTRGQPQYCDLR